MKPNGTKEKNSHRQDLTDTKLGPNSTIKSNWKPSEDDIQATITTNHFTIDCVQNDNELECDFTEIVEKYMRCEKRTLAEMLAMRDLDEKKRDSGNDMLKKLIESPDTWRIHPETEPVNPDPYPYRDYNDFCFTAPYNRCIRGGGMFKSCIGCPYYQGIVYAQYHGTGEHHLNGYGYTVSSTNEIVSNKPEKQRLDD